ncbi:MAG: Rieske 2Fe-2S domain-containing protein [Burkholderiaceae bacterium]
MLAADNELITRVGPGTPMGTLFRQFWLPACHSDELTAGAAPMRLLLLCEKLIAFRDAQGRVGIMEHQCPHRCASLFYGRNEGKGIRCAYHGWMFDVTGKCLETPNVPDSQGFSAKIRAKAYEVRERNGLVWVYMGDQTKIPPMPEIEATLLPRDEVRLVQAQRQCNWLQALEGDIDTSHFGFLHLGSVAAEDVPPDSMHRFAIYNRAPEYSVKDTSWGTMYCGYRAAEAGRVYHRISHFLFPCWTMFPDGDFRDNLIAQAWVPMDDTHTMVFGFFYKDRAQPLRHTKDGKPIPGLELDAQAGRVELLPNTTDWHGRWRTAANAHNDYLIDREAQRTVSFTGIESVPLQDQAMGESMGPICDRTREHLAPSDIMVVRTRRRILRAIRELEQQGALPDIAWQPAVARDARSGSFIEDEQLTWEDAYETHLKAAVRLAASPTTQP